MVLSASLAGRIARGRPTSRRGGLKVDLEMSFSSDPHDAAGKLVGPFSRRGHLHLETIRRQHNAMFSRSNLHSFCDAFGGRTVTPCHQTRDRRRPTFCVWELGAVGHEQQAWVRFLSLHRTARNEEQYLDDAFHGPV